MIRLSIIICTLNREQVLCDTLRAVVALMQGRADVELLVIDQTRQHEPETEACLADLADSLQLHRVDFASLTRARNHGVRLARGDVVLFLDDDIVPVPELLDAHLRCYEDPALAGVGGCMLLPGGSQISREELPVAELRRLERGLEDRFDLDWPRDLNWTPGCNMSFRREWLFRVGGFDEAFYGAAIGEEAELCHRVRKAGGRIIYAPAARILHLVNPSGGCRAAVADLERLVQALGNSWYYWRQTGVAMPSRLWRMARILRPHVVGFAASRHSNLSSRVRTILQVLTRLMTEEPRSPVWGLRQSGPAGTAASHAGDCSVSSDRPTRVVK